MVGCGGPQKGRSPAKQENGPKTTPLRWKGVLPIHPDPFVRCRFLSREKTGSCDAHSGQAGMQRGGEGYFLNRPIPGS